MEVIPVLDLMGGVAVHARGGARDSYLPMMPDADPGAVADTLLALAPFRRMYIADIDAIRGGTGHVEALRDLVRRHPEVEFWIDRGESDPAELAAHARQGPGVPVLGTEVLRGDADPADALATRPLVLSLDRDADGPLGPEALHADATLWPPRVIVMTLARVGSWEGPDLEHLAHIVALAGDREIYAAGGVRGRADLDALADIGVAGALVATALHDGRLSPQDLAGLR